MAEIVDIPVSANTAGDEVRVRTLSALSDSPTPAYVGDGDTDTDDPRWTVIAKVLNEDLPATVSTSPRPAGTYLWYQAAAYEDGVRASEWSTPAVVEIAEEPTVESATATADEAGGVVQFTLGGNATKASIRWDIHDPDDDAELGSAEEVDADTGVLFVAEIPRLSWMLTAEVTPVDASDNEGTAVTVTDRREMDTGTTQEPEHWLFTSDGAPMRSSDFRVLMDSGTEPGDDWYLTSEGEPMRFSNLEIVRVGE